MIDHVRPKVWSFIMSYPLLIIKKSPFFEGRYEYAGESVKTGNQAIKLIFAFKKHIATQ